MFTINFRKQRHYLSFIVYLFWSRRFVCYSKQIGLDRSIDDDRQPENNQVIHYIRSLNYHHHAYPPKRLSYYHVQCSSQANIVLLELSLQRPITLFNHRQWISFCVDYVNITSSDGYNKLFCGHSNGIEHLGIHGNQVMVTFRSSKYTNDRGFVVAVVCPNLSEQNQPGCLETKKTACK